MNINLLFVISLVLLSVVAGQNYAPGLAIASARADSHCAGSGTWTNPDDGSKISPQNVIADMAARSVVLLGERHEVSEQHRWQLHTLAALHGYVPNLAIGVEMLPRSAQPALDRWSDGTLSVAELLDQTDWANAWGFDPAPYLPIFQFARQNHLPMIALNVDRAVIARIGTEGLASVPVDEREGVGDPAPASDGYRAMLAHVFAVKARMHGGAEYDDAIDRAPSDAERREIEADPGFAHFVAAQQTWDRAMAEAIAARLDAGQDAPRLVVAMVGRGHAEHGYGIPHQLAALGVADVGVLLADGAPCEPAEAGIADAIFALGDWRAAQPGRPRLGVMIETAEAGVTIRQVVAESVAETTGLAVGDVVVEAAGVPVADTGELIAIVKRQSPGTWLPLVVRRDQQRLEMVAKFPSIF